LDSDEEGLEIDFHSKAVRPRVKLGVPNEELDTDNLDVEWIDDLIGEAWWHMRAPGTPIPGSPDSWWPPKEPKNWGGYVKKPAQVHHYWMRLIIQVVGICTHSHPNTRKGNIFVIKHQQ
jgi:hypothetical protein